MRVTVPVSYRVTAIKYKHQIASPITMRENVTVEVPDVPSEEMVLALVVRDLEGNDLERLYGHDGRLWVKDMRGEDDLPFIRQHMDMAGQKVSSQYNSGSEYLKASSVLSSQMGRVGLLRTHTGEVSQYVFGEAAYVQDGEVRFLEKTLESEKARKPTESNRDDRFSAAATTARRDCVCVDGVVYRRVPEPCIQAGSGYINAVSWRFGAENYVDTSKRRQENGYPISVRDFGRLEEWFVDEGDRPLSIDFSMEVVEPSYFTRRTDRIGMLIDATNIVERGLSRDRSTPFIHKWCELRDAVDSMWLRPDGRATTAEVVSMDEAEYERLAGLVEELAQLGDAVRDRGLRMWDSRDVSVPQAMPSPKF